MENPREKQERQEKQDRETGTRQTNFDLQELLRTKEEREDTAEEAEVASDAQKTDPTPTSIFAWLAAIRDFGRSQVATPLPPSYASTNITPTLKRLYSDARGFLASRSQQAVRLSRKLRLPAMPTAARTTPAPVFSGLDYMQKNASRAVRGANRLKFLANRMPNNLNPNTAQKPPTPDDPSFESN